MRSVEIGRGAFTARWGHYLVYVQSSDGLSFTGRVYLWPPGGEQKNMLSITAPDRDSVIDVVVKTLEGYGCKAFVDGSYRSLADMLAWNSAPIMLLEET